jgi:chromosome segregation ATPase
MDSVYKLTKYSQKIDEACRSKQLDKVIEYNKHELTYINKLSKYFGNQKGGATVDDVIAEIDKVLEKARDKIIDLTESNKLAIVTINENEETIKKITEKANKLETENKSLNERIKDVTQQLTDASSKLEVQVASQASQGGSKKIGKK